MERIGPLDVRHGAPASCPVLASGSIAVLSVALALLLQSALVVAPAPVSAPAETIVVTGVRMADLKAAVDACAGSAATAQPCTPRHDVIVSVRYAEAQFRTGDLRGARKTLYASSDRTRTHGKEEPIAISQLHIAQANVAAHLGDRDEVRRFTVASAVVLRDALGSSDPDTLAADLRFADLTAETDGRSAERYYVSIAKRAREAGHPGTAGVADLRRAWLLHLQKYDNQAKALLATLADSPNTSIRIAAAVSLARIARDRGDTSATDALVASLAKVPAGTGAATLLWQPKIGEPTDTLTRNPLGASIDYQTRSSDYNGVNWADIGFWIRPDGSVEQTEVLRGTPGNAWARPILTAIGGRRYAPFAAEAGEYHVERWTLTGGWVTPIGSLIRRRGGTPRFERLDLTEDPPAATHGG